MTMPVRYAVIGSPVAHSQSPFIHAEFARQTGEPVDYGRIECAPDGFAQAVRDFAAGGAGGCNVTVPFKFEAPRLAAKVSDRARLAEAANILRFDAEGWYADNTDGSGLLRDIREHAQHALQGQRVLLVGAGGAAAGVLGPLVESGASEVVVVNRREQRARELVDRHRALAGSHGVTLREAPITDPGAAFDVVINATASSLAGAGAPVAVDVLRPGTLAIDLMYGPAAVPFLRWAEAAGAVARDGLGMLVEQAAEAFLVWRGVRPETPGVLRALRERLARAS